MKIYNCRLCKGNLSEPKLRLPSTPLANEFVKTKEPQDLFPLEICVCEKCGHYQLNESVDPERLFRNYLFVAGTSPVNVEHFRQYAAHMIEKFDLKPNSKVLDIASNDGTLLKHFKDLGMKVRGIDPAENIARIANENGIETIPEFFTEKFADEMVQEFYSLDYSKTFGPYALITANNVFAHVPDLVDFTKGVKKLLAPQGVFSFEVSYFPDVCDKTLFDTIYHEHSSYHTIEPLISFFTKHGLDLFDVERIPNHGGSIRVFVRREEDKTKGKWDDEEYCPLSGCRKLHSKQLHDRCNRLYDLKKQEENIENKVAILQKNIKYLGLELREKLRDYKDQGKSIAIYGTPAKATTLMYALGIKEKWIDFAVDDAPLKQGTFTPGKHIPVYSSQAIMESRPDVLLILAWNFADSIIKNCKKQWEEYHRLNNMHGSARYPTFIIPLPELKIERYCENKYCTCGEGPWEKDYTKSGNIIEIFQCQACGGYECNYNTKCLSCRKEL
jgi:SAM-dependent methyltransferase